MISYEDYVSTDAVGWAGRVRAGEITALELIDAAIARAESVNPKINAIAVKTYETARAAAKAGMTGPLAGVPWAIKDMYQTCLLYTSPSPRD